jgi:hypothetical protein
MRPTEEGRGLHLGEATDRALKLECQALTDIQPPGRRLCTQNQLDAAIVKFIDKEDETAGTVVARPAHDGNIRKKYGLMAARQSRAMREATISRGLALPLMEVSSLWISCMKR